MLLAALHVLDELDHLLDGPGLEAGRRSRGRRGEVQRGSGAAGSVEGGGRRLGAAAAPPAQGGVLVRLGRGQADRRVSGQEVGEVGREAEWVGQGGERRRRGRPFLLLLIFGRHPLHQVAVDKLILRGLRRQQHRVDQGRVGQRVVGEGKTVLLPLHLGKGLEGRRLRPEVGVGLPLLRRGQNWLLVKQSGRRDQLAAPLGCLLFKQRVAYVKINVI